jgi:Flp pilus assembly protein TadD
MGELKLQQEDSSLKEIRESLAKTLANAVSEKGINAAVKAFYEAKSRNPDTYYVDQEEMDMLGQQLLQSKRVQEAIEVFKIIVQEFPESWKAYDSLGEAYLKNGDLDLARENYKKSLELNPRQYPWEMQVFEERLRLVKNLER